MQIPDIAECIHHVTLMTSLPCSLPQH